MDTPSRYWLIILSSRINS
ncbi:protein YsgD [Salmonella enterica subsp. enterica serovar Kiambu]|uniref:Protein YsgD n=28 Tax=Enterobacteriaceae TaxID=543 RepID=A0AAW7VDZ2_ECOLX|nr:MULTISPECIES: YsgD/CorL family protein [Enterobacteriaceae]MBU5648170.1 protein YsgD [Pluralibacter sp. S54_ASV_43]MCP1353364.1 protein YsgD [Salmonella sp. S87]MDK8924260.1 protein YsgD [Salmonella enterica subsp. enterica serovar Moualine]MDK8986583.1 protein YsgD [Salmonella enterica subsp. enterica serovar 1,4,[5],12:b:-]MDK9111374.1 protein YsgD [Salmonella enterica subsp. enterica serovar Aberdeen]MDQ9826915.1 YsgD/CorL family protein [Acinetobacter sp. 163]MDR5458182.1 protein YsgD